MKGPAALLEMTPAALAERLQRHHQRTSETPLFNPVFQLSLDLSRGLEAGDIALNDVTEVVSALEQEALEARAHKLARLVGPVDNEANLAAIRTCIEASAGDGFDAFRARWERPLLHAVFTAHPTFLLDAEQTARLIALVCNDVEQPRAEAPITLDREHALAMAAIAHAAGARDAITATIFDVASRHWPDRWQTLRPLPYRFATWVGYDMDGRTDIGWATSLRYRLAEKAQRLDGYAAQLADCGPAVAAIAERCAAAARLSGGFARELATLGDDPADLSDVANRLSADHPHKLVTLQPVMAELESLAAAAEPALARRLLVIVAAMRADGLGMGWIHFRLNSAQVENAIRGWLGGGEQMALTSHAAAERLRALLADETHWRTNFAALAIENTTALRQFLAIAQIVKHVDADAPVRLLIAECEQPQTILAALVFARRFGVEDHVDISPLFETESALEHGGRFLADLLDEPAYRRYVQRRGRLAIQTGFSDAGRFVGQIPAALAIERIHGYLARQMARHGLTDVAALIFNTHGESIGRGAHPASMDDRLHYPMSEWARQRFADAGIRTEMEVSYQGGDGYLLFGNPALALATLARVLEVQASEASSTADPFYDGSGRAIDFYRGIRRVQRDYLASRTYARAITAFGLGLLKDTGSRKSRRQSDVAADRTMSLRQIRAIPHNAVLQQLGYPVNVIAGFGTAAADDVDGIAALLNASPRGQQLVRMVRASNALASIKTVAAYGELFNSAYWASRPYRGHEEHIEGACLALAELLTKDDRAGVYRRFASRLRVDGMRLHRLLAQMAGATEDRAREQTRRSLGVLHAVRLALMQHLFLRAVQLPAFSRRNDISRDDMLEMIFSLRIDDAVALLNEAFPTAAPALGDFSVHEPADYPQGDGQAYAGIHRDYVEPMGEAYQLMLRIGVAIANHFGAHG